MNHKHEFDWGVLTEVEKADGGIAAVICKTCDFRQVSTSKLTAEELEWARKSVHEQEK